MKLRFAFLLSSFFLLISFVAHGQSTNLQGIDFELSNDSPAPRQNLTVKAVSFMGDLNAATMTWTIDGKVVKKGIGSTEIEITAPELGKKINIGVNAITSDGKTFSNSFVLRSGSIDLILETDGYVPPFFQGKTPLAFQNSYRLIAIPHIADKNGKILKSEDLVYQWTKDSRAVQDQSGYGKQVFSWKDEIVPRQRVINVKVSARDGSSQASKTIFLQADSPTVSMYIDDPLYGTLYNAAIGQSLDLGRTGEVSVLAIPFGFNKPASGNGDLNFNWLVNSQKQDALSANQMITFRAPGDQSGSSDIVLSVTNNEDIMQKAETAFAVTFFGQKLNNAVNTNFNGL